jgi:hypothetical protein
MQAAVCGAEELMAFFDGLYSYEIIILVARGLLFLVLPVALL